MNLANRINAAMGRKDCDLLIKNVSFLDVFSSEWRTGDIAIADGVIVGIEPGLRASRVIEGQGRSLVPGFIDAHVHIESSLMVPKHFEKAVIALGTTAVVCDPHELANVSGAAGIRYFLEAAERMSLNLQVMLSSCVPATHLETNGGGTIGFEDLLPLAKHAHALGLAEMMNTPGVIHADSEVLKKLEGFAHKPIDGHAPLLRGRELSAYASCGISSCHESSELEEAREKLIKGIAVWIREGSVAKDLEALVSLLNLATSTSVGFCTDDRNPLDIAQEGHLDHLIRGAIRKGVLPEVAYRSASWSVARHYGLDRGPARIGAIAPGYAADLVLLDDAATCEIARVFKRGTLVDELPAVPAFDDKRFRNSVRAQVPEEADLEAPRGQVHVIEVLPGKIITERSVRAHDSSGVARLSVLERYGRGSKPANAYVHGFGLNFRGAIASSVGHDSHNLIVVGSSTADMRVALASLIECGGGFSVVQNGYLLERLELPIGGLMSDAEPEQIVRSLKRLKEASQKAGCELHEPFLQLAFLSLPVIPSLKLTDQGLIDVGLFKKIDVRAS